MNIRDLEYFLTVVEEGHFGKAAHRCFVSQPTLSGQLRKLEEELGMPLFDRNTRSVKLSDFGREILPLAQLILENVQDIQKAAESHQDPSLGQVKLGVFPSLASGFLPLISPYLKKNYERSIFLFQEEKSHQLIEKLKNKELDLVVLAQDDGLNQFECSPPFFDEFWLLCSQNNPLAQEKSIELSQLDHEEILLLDEGHCLRDQVQDLCSRFGGMQNQSFRGTSLETLKQAVRMEIGVTLFPKIAIPKHIIPSKPILNNHFNQNKKIVEEDLVYLPFSSENNQNPGRLLHFCWRKTHPKASFFYKLSRSLIQFLEEQNQTLPVLKTP